GPVLTPPATSPRYKTGKALSASRPWGPIYYISTRTRIEKSRPRPSSSLRESAGPRGSAASAAPENWPPFDDASRKPALTRIDWSETERSRPSVRWWGNRVARFFENGRFDRALAFEQLCHERREVLPWSLLCAYDGRKLSPERHAAAFWDVLRNHSHLIPAGELGVALELFPT